MPLDVTRTIASVGCSIDGSSTVSTRTSWLPCQATAFIARPPPLLLGRAGLGHLAVHRGLRAVGQEAAAAALELRVHRRRHDPLLAGHQGLEAVARDVLRIVLVAAA